jgi:tyrosyl-tRNA synthetase
MKDDCSEQSRAGSARWGEARSALPREGGRQRPPLIAELRWRGLLTEVTPGLEDLLASGAKLTLYCGFDPTASSLHVGSLRPILALAWFQRHGHRPIALVGGGTGRIGDPSGKTVERQLLSYETIARNSEALRGQIARFLDLGEGPAGALMLDNADWLANWPLTDFLRDVGKHFRVGAMLQKESVRLRLGSTDGEGEGMSFTEFSYMLLQAADFLHLYRKHGCTLQIGGSDQFGNMTAGIDLIRRLEAKPAHALTFPLITTAAGVKFGKTEAGAVWLDAAQTPPYDFYQFWVRTDDRDVKSLLRSMTFLEHEEIEDLEARHDRDPGKREAHQRLAYEMTRLVHGHEAADQAREAAQKLFGPRTAESAVEGAPTTVVPRAELEAGLPLVDLLVRCGLSKSKGEARRLLAGGGVNLNEERVTDLARTVGAADLRHDGTVLLRTGKRNFHVVRAT